MAAAFLSASPSPVAAICCSSKARSSSRQLGSLSAIGGGLRLMPKIRITEAARRVSLVTPSYSKTTITCSVAQPETLKTVQSIIAKQLSVDESTVAPETKFADLGADSLDTVCSILPQFMNWLWLFGLVFDCPITFSQVEIMMTLEEKFGVSIGEGGAENIVTVQDAANLIEKVKAASA
ncbi:acyl carrier protein 2, chloroplastic-like isoform X1 [Rhodamnia argentea]|uniref:Acyl carrier protein 2, chloroplastic-like isoform X1 n=1 Tax=Rhodamnia argentea TaxID=178133 RepID=A0ABM3HTP7_9MYRT|nr:acyl carrier protein 2, chloroplastic-like isoform X1 [Rhodamnia argentea]